MTFKINSVGYNFLVSRFAIKVLPLKMKLSLNLVESMRLRKDGLKCSSSCSKLCLTKN